MTAPDVPTDVVHAAAVHFPIALLLFAAAHDGWRRWRKQPPPSGAPVVAGALGALAAVVSGWVLATGQEDVLIDRHRWLAVGVLALAVLALGTRSFFRGPIGAVPLWLAALLVIPTGWLGGEMAHGHDRGGPSLSALAASPMPRTRSRRVIDLSDAGPDTVALEAHRLLKRSCMKCHRAGKAKGGLRLDDRALMLEGGESGPAVVPGDDASLLLKSVRLPETDDDVMPKRGALLSPSEIALLERWVQQGAAWPADAP